MRFVRLGTLAAAAAVFVAGCDSAREIEARATNERGEPLSNCVRCHGFPPAQSGEVTTRPPVPHPQLAASSACHGSTVVEGTTLVEGGGTHLNGTVEVTAHRIPYIAEHSREALARPDEPLGQPLLAACTPCHGSDFGGGIARTSCNACHATLTPVAFPDWQTNCTFCHGTRTANSTTASPLAAPPQSVAGAPDAGAHQRHLTPGAFSNGVACTECHPVLTGIGHANGAVEIAFGPLANTGGATATLDPATTSCANYCHGATLPQPEGYARAVFTWAPPSPSPLTCDSCHQGVPTTGRHPGAPGSEHQFACSFCHGGTYTATVADRPLHVNGTLNQATAITGWNAADQSCVAVCHSDRVERWNPPQ